MEGMDFLKGKPELPETPETETLPQRPVESPREEETRLAKERLDAFTRKVDAAFDTLYELIDDKAIPVVSTSDFPRDAEGLKALLERLEVREKEIAATEEADKARLKAVEVAIEKFTPTSPDDLIVLRQNILALADIRTESKQVEAHHEACVDSYNKALDLYTKAVVHEAGFKSVAEVREAISSESMPMHDKRYSFFGLGRFLHKKEISRIETRIHDLEQIAYPELRPKHYYKSYSHRYERVPREALSKISEISNIFAADLERVAPTKPEALPSNTLNTLSHEYVDTTVRKSILSHIDAWKYSEETKDEVDDALSLLERSEAVDMNQGFRLTNKEGNEQNEQKRDEILREVERLNVNLRDILSRRFRRNVAQGVWKKFNEDVASCAPAKEARAIYADKLEQFKGRVAAGVDTSWFGYEVSRESYNLKGHEFNLGTASSEFEGARWKIFRENKDIQVIHGPALDRYEGMVTRYFMKEVTQSWTNQERTKSAVEKLLELGPIEAAPYVLMTAFKVGRDHGRYHLLSSNTGESPLLSYVESLKPEDMDTLQAMNIPGLVEIINLVVQNKDTFAEEYLEKNDSRVLNPVNKEIYDRLSGIGAALLGGKREDREFVLRILAWEGGERGLGEVQRDAIENILTSQTSREEQAAIRKSVNEALFTRFDRYNPDLEPLRILVGHDLLDDNQKATVISCMATKWGNIVDSAGFGRNPGLLVDMKRNLGPLVLEQMKSGQPIDQLTAHIAAKRFGMDVKIPTGTLVSFFEDRELLAKSLGNSDVLTQLVVLFRDAAFTKNEAARTFRAIADWLIDYSRMTSRYISQPEQKAVVDFVANLPTGPDFLDSEKDMLSRYLKSSVEDDIKKAGDTCTPENWQSMLSYYIYMSQGIAQPSEEIAKKLKEMFSNAHPENRDFCLHELQNEWKNYVATKGNHMSLQSFLVCRTVDRAAGAGNLKYVEGIAGIMKSMERLQVSGKSAATTKSDIYKGLNEQEERFVAEGWSEEDKTAFYNISKNILEASPGLYTNFLDVFAIMSAKELKTFAREYYPLYQANLVVLQNDQGVYDARRLVPVRKRLEVFKTALESGGDKKKAAFGNEKKELIDALQTNVEKRFGLIKMPETIGPEHIRTMQNCIRFIANINAADKSKELVLTLYLGLSLNGEWEKFRGGTEVNVSTYFKEDKAKELAPIIEGRKALFATLESKLGLGPEKAKEFFQALQEETLSSVIGNIQTIDLKLGNAKRSLEDLADPDLYATQAEKSTLALVMEKGKVVGATLAKLYRQASGKAVELTPEEVEVAGRLKDINGGEAWTPESVKRVQDSLQLPNLVAGVLKKMEDETIDEDIHKLQSLLKPSDEIVAIFNSFGEEFKPTSGAVALSQDLSYLENIIVKNQGKLKTEEKKVLQAYLDSIRSQMTVLEKRYTEVKEYFDKLRKSSHAGKNSLLKNRLTEIEKILYQSDEAVPINTRVTSNLNLIIENMRQCLGCLRKEVNNDTNLTFGDPNKFFIVSDSGKEKGSDADQIAYLLPLKAGEREEASLVVDQLYGAKSSEVLMAHIRAVAKKYGGLKKEFADAKTSIFVTTAAFGSAGLDAASAITRIKEEIEGFDAEYIEKAVITIPPSAMGDNYIEFGDKNARDTGERTAGGIRISKRLL